MTENDIITKITELSKSSIGFPLVFWGAYLLKVYVINGSIKRYFRARRKELKAINAVSLQLEAIIALHEKEGLGRAGNKPNNAVDNTIERESNDTVV